MNVKAYVSDLHSCKLKTSSYLSTESTQLCRNILNCIFFPFISDLQRLQQGAQRTMQPLLLPHSNPWPSVWLPIWHEASSQSEGLHQGRLSRASSKLHWRHP